MQHVLVRQSRTGSGDQQEVIVTHAVLALALLSLAVLTVRGWVFAAAFLP